MTANEIEGGYFDGQSAARHDVLVELSDAGLIFTDPAGRMSMWTFEELRFVSANRKGDSVTLAREAGTSERLRLDAEDIVITLIEKAPQLKNARPERGFLKPTMVAAAIIAIMVAMYFSYPALKLGIVTMVPQNWVVTLGESTVASIRAGNQICEEPEAVAILDQLVDRLIGDGAMPYDVQVSVVRSSRVNAFAAAGGQIVIFKGLIDKAGDADEVAGVLAHELGHVKHRHPLKRAVDIYGIDLFLSSMGGNLGSIGGFVLLLQNSREEEAVADAEGVKMLQGARISTSGFANFFARLSEEEGGVSEFVSFFSTHPRPDAREEAVRSAEDDVPDAPALTATQWQALRAICTDNDEETNHQPARDDQIEL